MHDLRHTFGSLLIQKGIPILYVKEQMGHSSMQVTVDIYGHLIPGANVSFVRLDQAAQQARETSQQQNATQTQLRRLVEDSANALSLQSKVRIVPPQLEMERAFNPLR